MRLARRRGAVARRPGGATVAARVWDAAKPPTSTSWIQRVSADLYYLWQPMGRAKYVQNEMRRLTPTEMAGDSANSETFVPPIALWTTKVFHFAKSVAFDDASVTYTGTGWLGTTSKYTAVVGDKAEWTTPANTAAISMTYLSATNRGYGRVLIDDDPTAANQLPTAQDEVDAGRLPASSLVTNGGTLQPTDRVLDFYVGRASTNPEPILADNLPAAVHTVTIEVTGYKRAESTEARISVASFYYIDIGFTPTTTGTTVLSGVRLRDNTAVQESAYNIKINNVYEWCGGTHANLTGTSETITVDGTPVTMTDGQVLTSTSSIQIDIAGTFHHVQSATPTANVTRTYTMDGDGLRIQHSTEWLVTATPGLAAYPAMLTLHKALGTDKRWADFASVSGSAITADIPLNGGDDEIALGESQVMWGWTPGDHYIAVANIDNAATSLQNWTYSKPRGNIVWDRNEGTKLYWSLYLDDGDTPMPDVTNGTIWAADTTYRWAYVTDADAVCSRS